MKLLPLYASASGLEIRRQWLLESFYPLPVTRYITLHASSGMEAKNYSLYAEVVRLIAHILNSQGIQIVQLGGKGDPAIPGCVHLQGKTDYHQSSYILRNSLLCLGNDSWLAHRAGELQRPLITLFGPTTPQNHGAYTFNPEKTSFIEAHRWGRRPTFAKQENPRTIDSIPPEQVANEVLRHLGIQQVFTHQSRYWGVLHQHLILDLVPDAVPDASFLPEAIMNVRLDYLHNEEVLAATLQTGRRVNLITKRPLTNSALLQHHRAQILSYNHELGGYDHEGKPVPETPVHYVQGLKALLPQAVFFTKETDSKALAALRFRYLDVALIEQTKDTTVDDYLGSTLSYLNREDTPQNRLDLVAEATQNGPNGSGLRFRSGKVVLAQGKAFPSVAHLKAGLPMQHLNDNTSHVIDDPAFWRDVAHMAVWYQPFSDASQPTS